MGNVEKLDKRTRNGCLDALNYRRAVCPPDEVSDEELVSLLRLHQITDKELMRTPNFGKKSLSTLKEFRKKVPRSKAPTPGYDYGTHECLDRTYIVMELFSYVSEHPQIKENAQWVELADKAHTALWNLYQSVGERA